MKASLAIIGAGVLGRLLALELQSRGWKATLFDRGPKIPNSAAASWVAAGMLSPYCELETSSEKIFRWGVESLEIWPTLMRRFGLTPFFQREGSLVVSHPQDRVELDALARKISFKLGREAGVRVSGESLRRLEPELDSRFESGLFFPEEGQIDNRDLLDQLGSSLERFGVQCRFETPVESIRPGEVTLASGARERYDWICDCRGLGAKSDFSALGTKPLRGVRGELIEVHAPEVRLLRPIRLMHPRYPLYVVPRAHSHYLMGATSLDVEERSPISVRSTLELLSAAYSLHPGFGEARILESRVGLRPAFADNHPSIESREEGLVRVNGLYRHGFLLGPKLVALVGDGLESGGNFGGFFS